jgi:PAS domain-containing protein
MIDAKTLRILAANTNAMRHLGYGQEELLRLTLSDIEVIEDSDSANGLEWTSSFSGTQVYELGLTQNTFE